MNEPRPVVAAEPGADTDERPAEVRVVVVDDHPVFREGLAALLDELAGVDVVGQAASGEAALPVVRDTRPDVVLMDLHLPGISGIEATRRLLAAHPRVAVLVLTMLRDDDSLFAALRAGARGYLLKEATSEEIQQAITAVAAGTAVLGGGIADRVLSSAVAHGPTRRDVPVGLTEREHDVLTLLARGYTNAAIAAQLYLSEKTVRNYVSTLFTKLGVTDRAAAVAKARDAGLGEG